jgi:WD40 repeat protein
MRRLTKDLDEWKKFFRREAHLIRSRPTLFLQQAANQPSAAQIARAAARYLEMRGTRRAWLRWINKPEQRGADLATLAGHLDGVTCCAFFPDGSRLVSGSEDGTLKIWRASTGSEEVTLISSTKAWEGVLCCAVSPDGALIASGSADHTVTLWDAETGAVLRRLSGHRSWVNDCDFFPDGTRIVSASTDGTLQVWSVDTGSKIATLEGHEEEVLGCAVSPDGSLIASASIDQTVRLWDAGTGREVRSFIGHIDEVTACAFSPDGKKVLSASRDKTLRLWSVVDGEEISRFTGHAHDIVDCAFSPDGSLILSAAEDWRALLRDASSGAVVADFCGHSNPRLTSCACSPDGDVVATASKDKTVILWDATMRTAKAGGTKRTTVIDWTIVADRELGPQEQRTQFWRPEAGSFVSIKCPDEGIENWAFSPDGSSLATAGADGLVRIWGTGTGDLIAELKGHSDAVRACSFSPDGKTVVSGSADRTLRLWDCRRKKETARLEGHKQGINLCVFSADGTRILSASGDRELRLWNPSRKALVALLSLPERRLEFAAFWPDGGRVFGFTGAGNMRLWDAVTGDELLPLYERLYLQEIRQAFGMVLTWSDIKQLMPNQRFPTEIKLGGGLSLDVSSCVISLDGTRFALGTEHGKIHIWDAITLQKIVTLHGPRSSVSRCKFSPDGRYLLTGSDDGSVVIWELRDGREVALIPVSGPVTGLHWSPDGGNLGVFGGGTFHLLKCENLPTSVPVPKERPSATRRRFWSRRDS